MKRVALALLIGMAAVAVWIWSVNFRGEDEIHDLPAPAPVAGMIEQGAYLARAGNCMACHTERGGTPWAGGRPIETPFGTAYAGNLTPHPETGLGRWSASDFWRAMHHGRSRDGRLLAPVFPYPNTTRMSRGDSDALFSYLQSLPPVERANRAQGLQWPYGTQAALAVWRALYFRPGTYRNEPTRSAEWNRGAYLVQGLGHCSACHTARNALGASSDLMDLSGGMIPMQNWYAPSLTSPAEAGVAHWKREHIVQLLQTGQAPGASVAGPMAEVVLHSTQHLSPADLNAMAVFLQALPQTAPQDTGSATAPAGLTERGGRLYEQHCAQCHGAQGQGINGAYPPLGGNRAVTLPVTANLVQVVLGGGYPPATAGNPRPFGMPPFATVLSDAEVAAVLTYIRTAWGNRGGAVSELDVVRQRSSIRP
jgi:mono/diheme cytochrome c family protein